MSCDLCIYCKEIAYITNGKGEYICYNRANTGACEEINFDKIAEPKEPKRIFGINRNTACPCGSGKKYKDCCLILK